MTRVARLTSTRARGRPYWDAAALRVARGARLASTVLLVSAGYYVGGIIGIALRFPPSGIATIWPPTAILLSALLLTPPRTWWVYLLAAIPTHIHLVANFQTDVPPVVMFAQVGTNVLHAVLAALAVRSAVGAPPRFDSLRSMVLYILYAPIASTIVACVLAASAFVLLGWAADFWLAFRQRVLANVFAIITIPPLIVMTATGGLGVGHYRRWSLYAELGLLTMALLAVGFLIFGRVAPASGNVPALLLTPMPLLLWAAVRLGPGGLCVCLLVIAGLSLSEAFAGRGPFVTASPAENTFSLQVFLLAISAPLMILAAIVQERERAESALHISVARIREMGGRLLTAQEEERTRIASELHDDVNQQLATLKLNLELLAGAVHGDGAPHVSEAIKLVNSISESIRDLSHQLSPPTLRLVGLVPALEGLIRERAPYSPSITFTHDRVPTTLPPQLALCAFRIVQEAVQNALKHSHATRISVHLSCESHGLVLTVIDDGVGFVVEKARQGLGLISMNERAAAMGGSVTVTSSPECGTTLTVNLPVPTIENSVGD